MNLVHFKERKRPGEEKGSMSGWRTGQALWEQNLDSSVRPTGPFKSCPRLPLRSSLITLAAVYGTTQMTKTHDFSVHERGPEQRWLLRSQLPEQGQSHTRIGTETLVTQQLVAIGYTKGLHPPSPHILHVQYSFFLLVKRKQNFLKRWKFLHARGGDLKVGAGIPEEGPLFLAEYECVCMCLDVCVQVCMHKRLPSPSPSPSLSTLMWNLHIDIHMDFVTYWERHISNIRGCPQ